METTRTETGACYERTPDYWDWKITTEDCGARDWRLVKNWSRKLGQLVDHGRLRSGKVTRFDNSQNVKISLRELRRFENSRNVEITGAIFFRNARLVLDQESDLPFVRLRQTYLGNTAKRPIREGR